MSKLLGDWFQYNWQSACKNQAKTLDIEDEIAGLEKLRESAAERLRLLLLGQAPQRKVSRRVTPTPEPLLLKEAILEIESYIATIDIKLRKKRAQLKTFQMPPTK
jgi:hypothetical protein